MRFESFELKVVIGKGKFGLVYTAQHAASQKYVAIKFISKGIIFETKGVQRIQQVWFCFVDLVNFFVCCSLSLSLTLSLSRALALQEMDILQDIHHPFIVHCCGVFEVCVLQSIL